MANKKYYAVRKGRVPGIYTDWDSCKKQVDKFPGGVFKGFMTLWEAEEYLNGNKPLSPKTQEKIKADERKTDAQHMPKINEGCCIAYVDGSYNPTTKTYGYGVYMLPERKTFSGHGKGDGLSELNNVGGEIMASVRAVHEAINMGYQKIQIVHDYEGISKWVEGYWMANTPLARQYVDAMNEMQKHIQIYFRKVVAHSDNYWNDKTDILAKHACGIT